MTRTLRRLLAPLAALALVAAACGGDQDPTLAPPADATTTTLVEAPHEIERGLPEAADDTALAIREWAELGDLDGLARLAVDDEGRFTGSFGESFSTPEELVAFWRTQDDEGEDVAGTIVALIDLPDWYETTGTDEAGNEIAIYVTPRFMHEPTDENRALLEQALGPERVEASIVDGQWLGWRLGIAEDGNWQFFVAGD